MTVPLSCDAPDNNSGSTASPSHRPTSPRTIREASDDSDCDLNVGGSHSDVFSPPPSTPGAADAAVCLSSSSTPVASSPSRSVCFSTTPDVQFPCRHSPLTEEEVSRLWYSHTEYQYIRRSNQFILQLMEAGCREEDEDQNDVCFRGLEFRTRAGCRRRRRRIDAAVESVLAEQERQWDEGIEDDDCIARVCRRATAQCVTDACCAARQDEAYVVDAYTDFCSSVPYQYNNDDIVPSVELYRFQKSSLDGVLQHGPLFTVR